MLARRDFASLPLENCKLVKEVNVFLQGPVAPFPVEQVKSLIALLSLSDRYEIAGKESENLVFTFTPR